ncbi:MAG: MATE family efflux transporter [Thomasclavelia sp.]|jgi:putative MATE family efflux protein|nr:MATE family efflux transporter [Thomasclavelia sp.]
MEDEVISKENKMGTMPINKLIISMSLPIIASMLVQALYNIVDSIFVAQISENALTAVSLAFPAQNLLIAFGTGSAVGINALLSRSLGEKNQRHVNDIARHAVIIWLVLGAIFALIGFTCGNLFFSIQTSSQDIINYGNTYFSIVVGMSVGLFGQVIFERLLQATGRSIFSMISQGTGAIINIILDPILIFGLFGMPKLGIAGAALATVIGQSIACLIALTLNLKFNSDIHITMKNFKLKFHVIKQIYAIAIPSIIMLSIGSVMTFGMNKILIGFSTTAAAVFGVYFKLQSFFFMPVFGLNNGLIPIIGYNLGASRPDRMKKAMFTAIKYAFAMMVLGLIIFELFPKELMLLFNASNHMLSIGVPALRIIAIHFPIASFCIVIGAVFQACGKSTYSLVVSLIRQLFVLLPVAYLLSLSGNINVVWLCFPIAELFSAIVSFYYYKRLSSNLIF